MIYLEILPTFNAIFKAKSSNNWIGGDIWIECWQKRERKKEKGIECSESVTAISRTKQRWTTKYQTTLSAWYGQVHNFDSAWRTMTKFVDNWADMLADALPDWAMAAPHSNLLDRYFLPYHLVRCFGAKNGVPVVLILNGQSIGLSTWKLFFSIILEILSSSDQCDQMLE